MLLRDAHSALYAEGHALMEHLRTSPTPDDPQHRALHADAEQLMGASAALQKQYLMLGQAIGETPPIHLPHPAQDW